MLNPEKFQSPVDETMKSFMDGKVQYKSGLELKAMRYADYNKHVVKWSLEPFPIMYIKPTDGKKHRYFIDFYLEFSTGDKFLVEVKSHKETVQPKAPKKQTQKAMLNYQKAMQLYAINRAKWAAAEEFSKQNKMRFIVLTEKELG